MSMMSKRELSRQDRRQRIMQAARHLVESDGAAGLSMRALAAKAGISAVTVYTIFGSKAGVLRAIVEEDRVYFARMRAEAGIDHGIDSIFRLVAAACDFYRCKEAFYKAVLEQHFAAAGAEIREILDPGRHKLWHDIVQGMADNGLFELSIDMDLLTGQLQAVFLFPHLRWCQHEISIDRLESEISLGCALLIKAVAAPDYHYYLNERIATFSGRLLSFSDPSTGSQDD